MCLLQPWCPSFLIRHNAEAMDAIEEGVFLKRSGFDESDGIVVTASLFQLEEANVQMSSLLVVLEMCLQDALARDFEGLLLSQSCMLRALMVYLEYSGVLSAALRAPLTR